MTELLKIQECMKQNEKNDYFYNFLLGCIIDIINPECLEPYGRYIIFGSQVGELFTKQDIDYIDLIKICLYALISRLLSIYVLAFIKIRDTIGRPSGTENGVLIPQGLENIDWDYLENRCSKTIPIYAKFLDDQLERLDEKSVLLFNREKRKLFQNKELFKPVAFQMPLPEGIKPDELDLYNTKECPITNS